MLERWPRLWVANCRSRRKKTPDRPATAEIQPGLPLYCRQGSVRDTDSGGVQSVDIS